MRKEFLHRFREPEIMIFPLVEKSHFSILVWDMIRNKLYTLDSLDGHHDHQEIILQVFDCVQNIRNAQRLDPLPIPKVEKLEVLQQKEDPLKYCGDHALHNAKLVFQLYSDTGCLTDWTSFEASHQIDVRENRNELAKKVLNFASDMRCFYKLDDIISKRNNS